MDAADTTSEPVSAARSTLEERLLAAKDEEFIRLRRDARAWIESTLDMRFNDQSDALPGFLDELKTGVTLGNLLNALHPGLVAVSPMEHASRHYMKQYENVNNFLQGCARCGVPPAQLFDWADLNRCERPRRVVDCLLALKANTEAAVPLLAEHEVARFRSPIKAGAGANGAGSSVLVSAAKQRAQLPSAFAPNPNNNNNNNTNAYLPSASPAAVSAAAASASVSVSAAAAAASAANGSAQAARILQNLQSIVDRTGTH